jgi:hypothetical protein
MNSAAHLLNVFIRVVGAAALVLGLAFWLGYGRSFTRLHMGLGAGLVIAMWALAGIVWRNAGRPALAAFAGAWGAVTLAFGITHGGLLPGPWHWVVAVVHLASGALTIVIGRTLAKAMSDRDVTLGQSTTSSL